MTDENENSFDPYAAQRRYAKTAKRKAVVKKYQESEKGKAALKKAQENWAANGGKAEAMAKYNSKEEIKERKRRWIAEKRRRKKEEGNGKTS